MVLPDGQFRFTFTAKNYETSVAFYRDGLELPLDHDWNYGPTDRGTVFLAGGGMIEVFGRAPGSEYTRPQGIGLLLQVDDADRFHQLAQKRGLTVVQEPATYPWGHRIVRLADPDGIVISLFSLIEEPSV